MTKAKNLLESIQKVEEMGSEMVMVKSGRYEGMQGLLLSRNEDGSMVIQLGDAPVEIAASEVEVIS